MLLPEPLDAALADCRALLRYATARGLQRMVTAALADRAAIAAMRDDALEASEYAADAVASSRAFFAPWDHAGVCTMAASVALDTGRPEDARAFASETRRFVDEGTFPSLLAHVYDAHALQLQGRADDALRAIGRIETALAARPYVLVAGRLAYVKSRAHRARATRAARGPPRATASILLQGSRTPPRAAAVARARERDRAGFAPEAPFRGIARDAVAAWRNASAGCGRSGRATDRRSRRRDVVALAERS